MKLKYIILIIVLLAILIIVSVFFYKGAKDERIDPNLEEEKTENYANYGKYSNISWGFEIRYPNGWIEEVSEEDEDGFSIGILAPKENELDMFIENVIISVSFAESQDFDEVIEIGIAKIKAGEATTLTKNYKTTLAGYSAYLVEYSSSDYVAEFKHLHYFVNAGEKWYQVLYTAEISTYDEYLEIANKIINSIVIEE